MLTFLFWNLKGEPPASTLARLVSGLSIDVLVLAECSIAPSRVLEELNGTAPFHHAPGGPDQLGPDIEVYARFRGDHLRAVEEAHGISMRRLTLPGRPDILLALVHPSSKLFARESSQMADCFELSLLIRDVEGREGHRRTVLVGDLNMNPFEGGVVSANGLNAVMDRRIASRGERTLKGRSYPFFYNPMWGLFGDRTPGPSGTFFRDGAEQVTYFWNMYDQVLFRPDLLGYLRNEDVRVLDSDGGTSLVTTDGRPSKTASDHLPILFRLEL